ncbi:MAG: SH3 domain-containing protein [Peptococcaceae bacterium]|nr:SH3 domain-containing protein [Peptococcaceae bacterium]
MSDVIRMKLNRTNSGPTFLAFFFLAFLMFFFLALAPGTAFADQATVKGSAVNLRSGPGVDNGIVGKALKGELFTILAKDGDWLKVNKAGTVSWIAGWLTDIKKTGVSVVAASSSAPIKGSVIEITADSVNIREGPGTANKIIGRGQKGNKFVLLDSSEGWHKISTEGTAGWIFAQYSKVASAYEPPKEVAKDIINKAADTDQVIINGSLVNVRSGPATSFSVVSSVPKGSSLKFLEQSSDWYKVQLDTGKIGWVASWLTQIQRVKDALSTAPAVAKPVTIPVVVDSKVGIVVPEKETPPVVTVIPSIELKTLTTEAKGETTTINIGVEEGSISYDIGSLNKPDRLYIDIKGYSPGNVKKEFSSVSDLVGSIRVGWYSKAPDLTRVVLDLKARINYQDVLSKDGKKLTLVIKPQIRKNPSGATIILDPGHGGRDPGAIGPSKVQEKAVNLAIALETERILKGYGINVILTRAEDVFVELADRPAAPDLTVVDAFVSIHSNANNSNTANGTNTYYLRENIPDYKQDRLQSMYLAQGIQKYLTESIKRQDRGLLQANFIVLTRSKAPAVLIETAFISNPEEEALLAAKDFQRKAAEGISRGIINYLTGK